MPEMAIGTIGRLIRRDLSKLSLDTLLSEIEPGEGGPVVTGAHKNMMAIRKDGRGLTIGEVALLQATTWWSPRLVGSAETVADGLQEIFENNCCDGFIITQAFYRKRTRRKSRH